ncbi:MAG: hypothetical protein U5L10_01435 [Candidatus Moranbacteria bacterium]|nr:hypothetical protein [Candidatus Moranbacteria bacterium]
MKKIIYSTIGFIVLAGLIGWLVFALQGGEQEGGEQGGEEKEPMTLEENKKDLEQYSRNSQIDSKNRRYKNKEYGISLTIPEEMTVSNFQEGRDGEVVLFQEKAGTKESGASWIQMFITPFDEEGPLTPERIKQDLPDLEIENPQRATLTQNDIKGLIFFTQDPSLGKIREVWFTRNGYLYQVTTEEKYEKMIVRLVESISFD